MRKLVAAIAIVLIVGCSTQTPEPQAPERTLTVGLVQKEIRNGMSQAAVAEALGSPNIVSRDGEGHESWIYDKIASEAHYKNSNFGAGLLAGVGGVVGSTLLLGIPTVNYDQSYGSQELSQRTLTVVVKFDNRSLVSNASYHSSRF